MLVSHRPVPEPAPPTALVGPAWLDAEVGERLAVVARTAVRVSGGAIAAVSVLDDGRQRTVAVAGPAPATTMAELTRLAESVAADGPLDVADLDPQHGLHADPDAVRPRAYVGVPVHDAQGRVIGTLAAADTRPGPLPGGAVLADLAGWVEAEIARADGRSPAIERMKDQFLATVSHELRTPLTSVKGALSLALAGVMGEMDDEVRTVLEVALENTDRLVRLVNDIVDLERLLGGQLPLAPTDTDAAALVAAALERVDERAAAAGVDIGVDVEPVALFVDVDRTVQLLGHLVGNAIKYSPPHALVTVTTTSSAEGVVFVVTDQGPGVPPEARKRIFERFAHADASDHREQPGSGLGLPLARGLAEQQGGWLEVAPAPDGGASFRLTLPLPVRSKVVL